MNKLFPKKCSDTAWWSSSLFEPHSKFHSHVKEIVESFAIHHMSSLLCHHIRQYSAALSPQRTWLIHGSINSVDRLLRDWRFSAPRSPRSGLGSTDPGDSFGRSIIRSDSRFKSIRSRGTAAGRSYFYRMSFIVGFWVRFSPVFDEFTSKFMLSSRFVQDLGRPRSPDPRSIIYQICLLRRWAHADSPGMSCGGGNTYWNSFRPSP